RLDRGPHLVDRDLVVDAAECFVVGPGDRLLDLGRQLPEDRIADRRPFLAVEAKAAERAAEPLALSLVLRGPKKPFLGPPEPDLERIPRSRPARVGRRGEDPRIADPAARRGAQCLDRVRRERDDHLAAGLVVLAPPADRPGLQVNVRPPEMPDRAVPARRRAAQGQRESELPMGRVSDQRFSDLVRHRGSKRVLLAGHLPLLGPPDLCRPGMAGEIRLPARGACAGRPTEYRDHELEIVLDLAVADGPPAGNLAGPAPLDEAIPVDPIERLG